jgi:hypothetical protein
MQCEDAVTLGERGVYRFDYRASTPRTIDDVCSLKVYAGAADVRMASMTAVLQAGTMMLINRHCGDMIPTYEVDVRTHDELDDWSRERARAR